MQMYGGAFLCVFIFIYFTHLFTLCICFHVLHLYVVSHSSHFFYLVALFSSMSVFICVCPDEESGYSCLHRCLYGGIVDDKFGHQSAAKRLIKVIL